MSVIKFFSYKKSLIINYYDQGFFFFFNFNYHDERKKNMWFTSLLLSWDKG